MSLTQSAERAALNKLIDYLDDNPQENIDKIMDLVNKLVPNRVFPVQREAFTNVIKSRGNWYDLIMRVFSLNPQMRTKLLKTLIVDANLLAWPEQEKNREKYQCNVPWAILLDPTSACNLHCTGCWAAEYGYKQNLSFELWVPTSTSTLVASHWCASGTSSEFARSTRTAHSCALPTPR